MASKSSEPKISDRTQEKSCVDRPPCARRLTTPPSAPPMLPPRHLLCRRRRRRRELCCCALRAARLHRERRRRCAPAPGATPRRGRLVGTSCASHPGVRVARVRAPVCHSRAHMRTELRCPCNGHLVLSLSLCLSCLESHPPRSCLRPPPPPPPPSSPPALRSVRESNIVAAKAVADAVRTSLGPRGMDKMISSPQGEVVITNDGATILKQMEVSHPTAKMLVDLSASQDVEAGDGTTTVTVIAGSLLNAAEQLLRKGIHPTVISESFLLAAKKSDEILQAMSVPVDLGDREQLIKAASTSLNSRSSNNASLLAPLAVDAMLSICDKDSTNVDLRDIAVVKKLGGTIDDTELVHGLVFTRRRRTPRGSHQGQGREDRPHPVLPLRAQDGHRAERGGVGLLADGPHPQGGAQVHPRHVQDPEVRVQRPPRPEVHPARRGQRAEPALPGEDEDPRRQGHRARGR